MTTAEKLTAIAENQQKVYNAGYAKGKAEGGGGCEKANIVVTKEPTCSEEGERTFTCAGCGAIGTEPIPTVDHVYDGSVCTVCGAPDPSNIDNYPVKDGLKGLYDLGVDENASTTNHVPNATNESTATGVEYADKYAIFSGSTKTSRVNTGICLPLGAGVTLIALFRVESGRRPIIGSRRGVGTSATCVGMNLENTHAVYCVDGVAKQRSYGTPINSSNFTIVAMVADTSGYRVVRYTPDGNEPLTEVNAYADAIDAWDTSSTMVKYNAFSIGGDANSNGRETAHISLAAIHEGMLGDDQLTEACKFVYDYGVQKHGADNIE